MVLRLMPLALVLALLSCTPSPRGPHEATAPGTLGAIPRDGAGERSSVVETGTLAGSYLAALHAEQMGDDAAAVYLSRALRLDQDNADLAGRALFSLVRRGEIAEAAPVAEVAVASVPDYSFGHMVLAAAAIRDGDFKTAEAHLRDIPDEGLDRYLAPLLRAWVGLGKGDETPVADHLAPISLSQGFALLGDLHAGLIYELQGKAQLAESRYRAALGARDHTSFRVVDLAGGFYERHGRMDETRKIFESYMAENPDQVFNKSLLARLAADHPPPPVVATARDGTAEVFFDLASVLQAENATLLALVYGRLALYLRPDLDAGWLLVGDILAQKEDPGAALKAYVRVSRSSPYGWPARLREAIALDELGHTGKAVEQLQKMVEEDRQRVDAAIILGDILRYRERYEDAIAAYDTALGRVKKLESRHWPLLYSRGIALERSGQWVRAEDDLLRALELEPDQPQVLNYLAYSWADQGINLPRARRMLETAVARSPEDGYIVDSLGWVLYRMGAYEEAARRLEQAVELEPQDFTINDHLGDAYWRAGRQMEARYQWRRAASLAESEVQRQAIEQKLQQGLPADSGTEKDGISSATTSHPVAAP